MEDLDDDFFVGKRQKVIHLDLLGMGEFEGWENLVRYELVSKLGRGSYGEVTKARDRESSEIVAIKQMKHIFDEATDATRAYREMHILRHLKHPAVIELKNVICPAILNAYQLGRELGLDYIARPKNFGNLYLVFEFIDTDLQKILRYSEPLGEMHIKFVIFQILDGLRYIQESNVIHRDLKPANILLMCASCTVKIADFGLSRVVGADLIATHDPNNTNNTNNANDDNGSATTEAELPSPMDIATTNVTPTMSTLFSTLFGGNNKQQQAPSSSSSSIDAAALAPSNAAAPLPPRRPFNLKRGLTRHVVTRWYRAPEIILLQPYTTAVDIWSIGCIFAELLAMSLNSTSRRKALFPGESCGELSAEDLFVPLKRRLSVTSTGDFNNMEEQLEHERRLKQSYEQEKSQLNVIMDVLGSPLEEELQYLDPVTAEVVRKMPKKPRKELSLILPHVDFDTIDLLQGLLRFDPTVRLTAAEALQHRYFDNLREDGYLDAYEGTNVKENKPMNVDLEKIAESSDHLRDNIIQEVLAFRSLNLAGEGTEEILVGTNNITKTDTMSSANSAIDAPLPPPPVLGRLYQDVARRRVRKQPVISVGVDDASLIVA